MDCFRSCVDVYMKNEHVLLCYRWCMELWNELYGCATSIVFCCCCYCDRRRVSNWWFILYFAQSDVVLLLTETNQNTRDGGHQDADRVWTFP